MESKTTSRESIFESNLLATKSRIGQASIPRQEVNRALIGACLFTDVMLGSMWQNGQDFLRLLADK